MRIDYLDDMMDFLQTQIFIYEINEASILSKNAV